VTDYEGIAQQLVWQLKFAGARQAARQIAQCIVPLLRDVAVEGSLIVPVPTSSSHVRQRGFDQAKLIARAAAKQAGVHYVDGLIRAGQTRQVGASRQLRLTQLHQAFRVRKQACGMMQDAHVVLIDDVVTTGATLEAAAAALVDAGARRIDAVVFAQPERV
jgi:ComF family protein